MLTSLKLRNFQAHVKEELELGRLTFIVGPNDRGKSSIFRALRWLCLNRPSGEAFMRKGTDSVLVRAVFEGEVVVRSKGPKGNRYQLNKRELKAFGSGKVPIPVVELTNISELNFQGQHESLFWFSLTPGQVSRELNSIIDLDVIDSSLAHVAQRHRIASTREQVTKERLEQAKELRDSLDWVPEMLEAWNRVQSLQQEAEEVSVRCIGLASVANQAASALKKLQETRKTVDAGTAVLGKLQEALQLKQQAASLRQLLTDIQEAERKAVVPNFQPVLEAYDCWKAASVQVTNLQSLLEDIHRQEAQLCQINQQLAVARKKLGKRCPMCNSPIQPIN